MKAILFVLALAFASQTFAGNNQQSYPLGPDPQMTPGALCDHPDNYRYPEHIAYCNRDVASDTKRAIIAKYDETFGYRIQQMDRKDFKIDHYIPLCAGGANEVANLWPQHKSVFEITDQLEATICEKMAAGKLLQKEAIGYIRAGKADLSKVDGIMAQLRAL